MTARELVSGSIPTLNPKDSGSAALAVMDELRVSHLPIVENGEYIGLISDTDILTFNNVSEAVGKHPLANSNAYVFENQHIYDVIRAIDSMKLTLLPVLDTPKQYIGSITLTSLSHSLPALMNLNNPGGIIILELNDKDYLLTEIAGIVESNDAKVLGMYVTTFHDSTRMEIALKINKIEIGPILQTFQRFNYSVKASYSDDTYSDSLRDRYNELMNYLNI